MAQHQTINKFVLGNKELEGKTAEFLYDKGTYYIMDIVGEERTQVYKSRNMDEAYMKWNVYIGRKKERPERRRDTDQESQQNRSGSGRRQRSAARTSDGGERAFRGRKDRNNPERADASETRAKGNPRKAQKADRRDRKPFRDHGKSNTNKKNIKTRRDNNWKQKVKEEE